MATCGRHGKIDDHSNVIRGVRIWTCTHCGSESQWGDGWSYDGILECKACWRPSVDRVACSESCRAALKKVGKS